MQVQMSSQNNSQNEKGVFHFTSICFQSPLPNYRELQLAIERLKNDWLKVKEIHWISANFTTQRKGLFMHVFHSLIELWTFLDFDLRINIQQLPSGNEPISFERRFICLTQKQSDVTGWLAESHALYAKPFVKNKEEIHS